MLWRGRNALTFGRGTTCSLSFILSLWGPRGITSWSLSTSCATTDIHKAGRRSREATCTGDYGANVASHRPEARLKGESQCDSPLRRAGVIDSCLLWISESPQRASGAFIYTLYNSNYVKDSKSTLLS